MIVRKYYIVREGKGNTIPTWKPLSRGFYVQGDANKWLDYQKSLKVNKGYDIFLCSRTEEELRIPAGFTRNSDGLAMTIQENMRYAFPVMEDVKNHVPTEYPLDYMMSLVPDGHFTPFFK